MRSVPRSSQFYRDERASKPGRPLRLDFNYSSCAGSIVVETAPAVVAGRCHQSALLWIAMNIADHFRAGRLATNVAVIIAFLPELLLLASQLPRSDLLEGLEKLGHENRRRFVHEQMNMFRHQHVGIDSRLMTCMSQLQHCFNCVLRFRRFEKRETAKAAEGNEVESFRFLEPLQTVRHGAVIIATTICADTRSSR